MIRISLGDITYPKSDILISPINICGIMNRGISLAISKNGGNLKKEVKEYVKKNKNIQVGDFFITDSFRYKRRGVKYVYHAILTKYPNEYIHIDIVKKSINKILKCVLKKDNIKSITIPSMGLEDIHEEILARNIIRIAEDNHHLIDIKIISDNKKFINLCKKYIKIDYYD